MPREKVILDEKQTAELEFLANSPIDPSLASRARIILELAAGRSVREIASKVGLNKDAVTRWKTRYLSGGINALHSEHGGGAAPSVRIPDIQERIRQEISTNTDVAWTRPSLAEKLDIPVSALNRELAKMRITLSRTTSWEFRSKDGIRARHMCLAGLYLSAAGRCIIVCTSEQDIIPGGESFTTRNRLLANTLKSAGDSLTLSDALWSAADHAADKGKKNPVSLQSFLDETISLLPKAGGVLYYAIGLSDKPVSYNGTRPSGLIYQEADTAEEWDTKAGCLLRQFGSPSDQKAIEAIVAGIRQFNGSCLPGTDPVVWRKSISTGGGMASLTAAAAGTEPIREGQTPHGSTAEDLLEGILAGEPLGDKDIDCAMIPVIRYKGGLLFQVVRIPDPFPASDSFDFSTREGFMAGFDKMEGSLVRLRYEAGKTAAALYLDAVKKTNGAGRNPA